MGMVCYLFCSNQESSSAEYNCTAAGMVLADLGNMQFRRMPRRDEVLSGIQSLICDGAMASYFHDRLASMLQERFAR